MDRFCPSCGEILPALERADQQLEVKDDVIADQRRRIGALQSVISQMKGEADAEPVHDPLYHDAREVFEYWKQQLSPRAREFTDERFTKVIARLRAGHSVEYLKRAIDGCALKPYVVDPGRRSATGLPSERQAKLELICKSESKLEAFVSFVDEEEGEREHRDLVPAGRLARWQDRIDRPRILDRLRDLRGWQPEAVRSLGLGLDGRRVVFPIHDGAGKLVGLCRYQPDPGKRSGAKLVAEGARELFPPPETVDAKSVWLVEGEPDAVACPYPAVAVPGVNTWGDGWAERFADFDRVYICFDCDDQGREAADRRFRDLASITLPTTVDLDPTRDDGYDIGDVVLEMGEAAAAHLSGLTKERSGTTTMLPFERRNGQPPFDAVVRILEDLDCRVKHRGPGAAQAQCPVHEDRVPSMTLSEGDDGRVLLHCHAGCEPEAIVAELGLEMRDLFAA